MASISPPVVSFFMEDGDCLRSPMEARKRALRIGIASLKTRLIQLSKNASFEI